MAKLTERKYGPKVRSKDRDTTGKRYVARKTQFGEGAAPRAKSATYAGKSASGYTPRPSGYAPRTGGAPVRPSATGYVKRTFTPGVTTPRTMERKDMGGHTGAVGAGSTKPYERKSFAPKGAYVSKPRSGSYAPKSGANAARTPTTYKKSTSWSKTKSAKAPFGERKTYVKREDAGAKRIFKPVFKSVTPNKPRTAGASWGAVASWYDKHLNEADTYHEKVLLPNLLRLIDASPKDNILDLACGQGFFTRAIAKSGAKVTGIDIAPELIEIAQKESPEIPFFVGSADQLAEFGDASFNKVLMSLSIQNMENIEGVTAEVARVLNEEGELHIAMNHPAFRVPKQSAWDYDDKKKVQFRRVDQYLSNSSTEIDMHPGFSDAPQTISFHRPLQFYVKALAKAGFAIIKLEEWISHKASDSGPRAKAENNARKEIPLFLYMKAIKLS